MAVIPSRNTIHPRLLHSSSPLLDPTAGADPKNHELFRIQQPSTHLRCIAQRGPPSLPSSGRSPARAFRIKPRLSTSGSKVRDSSNEELAQLLQTLSVCGLLTTCLLGAAWQQGGTRTRQRRSRSRTARRPRSNGAPRASSKAAKDELPGAWRAPPLHLSGPHRFVLLLLLLGKAPRTNSGAERPALQDCQLSRTASSPGLPALQDCRRVLPSLPPSSAAARSLAGVAGEGCQSLQNPQESRRHASTELGEVTGRWRDRPANVCGLERLHWPCLASRCHAERPQNLPHPPAPSPAPRAAAGHPTRAHPVPGGLGTPASLQPPGSPGAPRTGEQRGDHTGRGCAVGDIVKPHSSQAGDRAWNFPRPREGPELARLLEAMAGSLTAPGEPGPAEHGERARPASITRRCGPGLAAQDWQPCTARRTERARHFPEARQRPLKYWQRLHSLHSHLCQVNYCKYEWQGHLALRYQAIEQKRTTGEEYSYFFTFYTMTTSLPSSQLSSLDQSCFK